MCDCVPSPPPPPPSLLPGNRKLASTASFPTPRARRFATRRPLTFRNPTYAGHPAAKSAGGASGRGADFGSGDREFYGRLGLKDDGEERFELETDRGGGAGSREGSGSGGSDAAEGGNLGAEKPARSGVEEEEVLLSGDGGDAGVALRSEEESESKLRARGGRQVMRRSSMVAKQVISIESALGLGQKVRLALEEKGIDYTSFHMNPITGKNLRPSFFRMNPTAKLPVFQNGSHVIFDTIEIIQYIERIAVVSVNNDSIAFSSDEVIQWMHKIQEWNPKFFTLSHVPEKYRQAVSKFFRRVLIARMAESPDLASSYHRKLKEAYHTEEKLRDPEVVRRSKEHLIRLLDEIEDSLSKTYIAGEEFSMADRLSKTAYIAGEEFSMADVMFIPVLARLALLNLEDEYINSRPNMAKYWSLVQQRPSYKKVIGRYFGGWRKYRTLAKTWCFIRLRNTLKKY